MKKIVFEKCPYCNSENLVLGFQIGNAVAYPDVRGGMFGSKIEHLICKECGSIVYSRVLKPDMFNETESTEKLEVSVAKYLDDDRNKTIVEKIAEESKDLRSLQKIAAEEDMRKQKNDNIINGEKAKGSIIIDEHISPKKSEEKSPTKSIAKPVIYKKNK